MTTTKSKRKPDGMDRELWFWINTKRNGACLETLSAKNADGYGRFNLNGTTVSAHRYAYESMRGPIPVGSVVCHTCDNPACVRIEHLFVGTHADNMLDMKLKGRRIGKMVGAQCPRARLSTRQVRAIRRARAAGCTLRSLAERYDVTLSCVSHVARGDVWKHVA